MFRKYPCRPRNTPSTECSRERFHSSSAIQGTLIRVDSFLKPYISSDEGLNIPQECRLSRSQRAHEPSLNCGHVVNTCSAPVLLHAASGPRYINSRLAATPTLPSRRPQVSNPAPTTNPYNLRSRPACSALGCQTSDADSDYRQPGSPLGESPVGVRRMISSSTSTLYLCLLSLTSVTKCSTVGYPHVPSKHLASSISTTCDIWWFIMIASSCKHGVSPSPLGVVGST
jgi:hypothetical protein